MSGLLLLLATCIFRTVGPSLASSLEPLSYRQNVASLSLFYRYYFGRYSSELAQLDPLSYSQGRPTDYSDGFCHQFLDFTRMSMSAVNSLPIECFPLTYDQNDFKFRINRYILTVGSFSADFLYALIFLCFLFL